MLANKKILITNDDSLSAQGIYNLTKKIYKYTKDILVIAPKEENSAVSHKLTIRSGIKVTKETSIYKDILTYSVVGTPADCVKYGIVGLGFHPDYVISGINDGLNLGNDILYSGTVAACFEAGLNNVKAIAFSIEKNGNYLTNEIEKVLEYISNNPKLRNKKILNVNIPQNNIGIKITHQGLNPFDSEYVFRNGEYYSIGKPLGKDIKQDPNSDVLSYHEGYISITPLTIDRTDWND